MVAALIVAGGGEADVGGVPGAPRESERRRHGRSRPRPERRRLTSRVPEWSWTGRGNKKLLPRPTLFSPLLPRSAPAMSTDAVQNSGAEATDRDRRTTDVLTPEPKRRPWPRRESRDIATRSARGEPGERLVLLSAL